MSKLALLGGEKTYTGSHIGWHIFGEPESAALKEVAESGVIHGGAQLEGFKKEFSEFAGTEYVLPVANGTVSLELIFRTLGIGYGDEVIVPSYTFIASVSSIIFTGAKPVFGDVDPSTFLLSAEDVERKITPKTKAVLGVHVGGRPCDLDALKAVCDKHGIYLVEDCAQAVGSTWKGEHVGLVGAFGSISTQNSKNLTCGEGGIVLTKDKELYEKALVLYNGGCAGGSFVSPAQIRVPGEMQCAILRAQLKRLPDQIDRRMENIAYLESRLKDFPFVVLLKEDPRITRDSHHLHIMRLNTALLKGVGRDKFLRALNAEGVPYASGYCNPCHTSKVLTTDYVTKLVGGPIDVSGRKLPNTERVAYIDGIWAYHTFFLGTKADMDMACDAFEKVYANLDELAGI